MTSYFIDTQGIYANDGRIFRKSTAINSPDVTFSWLLNDNPKQNKLLYDLDACVAGLISQTLTRNQAQELYEKERVYVNGYKLTYFPTRFFAIDGRNCFVNYGNMVRYKSDVHYMPEDTDEDKIAKAKEAETIAVESRRVLRDLSLDTNRIISPVSAVIDKYVWSLRPPTVDDIPEEAGEFAFETIKGNHLEAYKMGYWEEAYDADLNSAYASELMKLLDTRRGTWVNEEYIPDGAVYGFAQGLLKVEKPFHPFLLKASETYTYTPIGAWTDYLTLQQIQLLNKYKLGEFDVKNGWWWIPSNTRQNYEPLRGIINRLFNIRSQSSGLKKVILRQIMAGIWGRMLEVRKDKLGKMFNPVWASIVENNIKCKVVDTCLSAGITPLLVAVDGVITDKPLPIQDTLDIGEWRLSHKGRCIIVSSGVVGFEGKQGAEEFALSFDWLYDQIKEHPELDEYSMTKYTPLTLAKAMSTNQFEKVGELQLSNRTINIGRDYKRMWKEYPKTGGELISRTYDSLPVDSVMVQQSMIV